MRPTETTSEVVTAEPGSTEPADEAVTTQPRPPDTPEIAQTGAQPTDTSAVVEQTERRPDLVWDAEAPGLCVRIYEMQIEFE
jgi:hypothetical protein